MKTLQNPLPPAPPATGRAFPPRPSLRGATIDTTSISGYEQTLAMAPKDRDMPFSDGRNEVLCPSHLFRVGEDFQPLYQTLSRSSFDSLSPTPVDLSVSANRRRTTSAHLPNSFSSNGVATALPDFAESTSSYYRRRTTSQLPRLDPRHGNSTVARSFLTASASARDISLPAPRPRGPLFSQLRRAIPRRPVSPIFDIMLPPSRLNLTTSASANNLSQVSPMNNHRFREDQGSTQTCIPSPPAGSRRVTRTTRSNLRTGQTFNDLSLSFDTFEDEEMFKDERVASSCAKFENQPLTPLFETKELKSNLRASQTVNGLASSFETLEYENEFRDEPVASNRVKFETRIPSPQFETKEPIKARRYVSTPVLQSHKKENVVPDGLLRPISPSQHQPTRSIPKSRTLGNLRGLSTAFSRSNLNLSSRFSSTASLQTSAATIEVTMDNAETVPFYNSNPHLVYIYETHQYWLGRFIGLTTRYQNEMLELQLTDPEAYRQHVFATSADSSPDKPSKAKKRSKGKDKKKRKDKVLEENRPRSTPFADRAMVDYLKLDEDQRSKRVFGDLEGCCMTENAKQSLWDYQLQHAREQNKECLLPVGGRMVDKVSVLEKVGRAVEGASTSLSKRSATTSLGRRKEDNNEQKK